QALGVLVQHAFLCPEDRVDHERLRRRLEGAAVPYDPGPDHARLGPVGLQLDGPAVADQRRPRRQCRQGDVGRLPAHGPPPPPAGALPAAPARGGGPGGGGGAGGAPRRCFSPPPPPRGRPPPRPPRPRRPTASPRSPSSAASFGQPVIFSPSCSRAAVRSALL